MFVLRRPASDLGRSAASPTPADAARRSCALCLLVRHLERPRIDDEADLVWLPEMSQPALNITMREIHLRLRALGESLDARHSAAAGHAGASAALSRAPALRTLRRSRRAAR